MLFFIKCSVLRFIYAFYKLLNVITDKNMWQIFTFNNLHSVRKIRRLAITYSTVLNNQYKTK